jgi:hypothetical protein
VRACAREAQLGGEALGLAATMPMATGAMATANGSLVQPRAAAPAAGGARQSLGDALAGQVVDEGTQPNTLLEREHGRMMPRSCSPDRERRR